MSRRRRRFYKVRREFKHDLYAKAEHNPAMAVMIIKTYAASQHRSHIMNVWWLLRNHRAAQADYNENLFGKHLTGRDEIMNSLYFAEPELYHKYSRKLPEAYAMGDALAVAYSILREMKKRVPS
ncbi:hypothetical protein ACFSR7_15455 [Cohnella sp. GCM10020058]|uniref:hypothetical protein n=1 Tax=Cohnella sp. GCM10020058 TaxID=3317330 RepID=UPI0036325F6E